MTPTLLANWQIFTFNLNIEFYILTDTNIIPRIFTLFHVYHNKLLADFAFKTRQETTLIKRREVIKSETKKQPANTIMQYRALKQHKQRQTDTHN